MLMRNTATVAGVLLCNGAQGRVIGFEPAVSILLQSALTRSAEWANLTGHGCTPVER